MIEVKAVKYLIWIRKQQWFYELGAADFYLIYLWSSSAVLKGKILIKLISSHANLERTEKWEGYWEVNMERRNGEGQNKEGHKNKRKGGTHATCYFKAHVTRQLICKHIGHGYTLKHTLKNKFSIRQRFMKKDINEKAREQSANPFS